MTQRSSAVAEKPRVAASSYWKRSVFSTINLWESYDLRTSCRPIRFSSVLSSRKILVLEDQFVLDMQQHWLSYTLIVAFSDLWPWFLWCYNWSCRVAACNTALSSVKGCDIAVAPVKCSRAAVDAAQPYYRTFITRSAIAPIKFISAMGRTRCV